MCSALRSTGSTIFTVFVFCYFDVRPLSPRVVAMVVFHLHGGFKVSHMVPEMDDGPPLSFLLHLFPSSSPRVRIIMKGSRYIVTFSLLFLHPYLTFQSMYYPQTFFFFFFLLLTMKLYWENNNNQVWICWLRQPDHPGPHQVGLSWRRGGVHTPGSDSHRYKQRPDLFPRWFWFFCAPFWTMTLLQHKPMFCVGVVGWRCLSANFSVLFLV